MLPLIIAVGYDSSCFSLDGHHLSLISAGPQGGPGPQNGGGSGYNNWNGWGGPQGGPVGPGGLSGSNGDMGYGRGPGVNNGGQTPAGPTSAGPGPGPVGIGGANVKTDHYGNNYGNGYGNNGGYSSVSLVNLFSLL